MMAEDPDGFSVSGTTLSVWAVTNPLFHYTEFCGARLEDPITSQCALFWFWEV